MDVSVLVLSAPQDPFTGSRSYPIIYADTVYHLRRVPGPAERAYGVSPACVRSRVIDQLMSCRDTARVTVTLLSASRRRYRFDGLPRGSVLVTGEPWYPGWSASNGATVRRVGYLAAFGTRRRTGAVVMSYSPPGLVLGLAISLLALIGAAVTVLRPGPLLTGLKRRDLPSPIA
jgi:hypothetical protein